ncbi:hypothetical protein SAMN02744102_02224 [Paenibacillus barengoltzii]|nr:hypothetical protein SAMN02744102_02224 [Paenibacillus barengoltzii]
MNIMENEQKRQMCFRSEEIANHRSSAFKNLLKMDLFLSWSLCTYCSTIGYWTGLC